MATSRDGKDSDWHSTCRMDERKARKRADETSVVQNDAFQQVARVKKMPKFRSVIIMPEGRDEGRYEFEAPLDFLSDAPARILDSFVASVQGLGSSDVAIDNVILAANTDPEHKTITGMGKLLLRTGDALPFVIIISEAPALR